MDQQADYAQVKVRHVERRERDQVDVTNTTSDDLAAAVLRIIIKQQADAPRLFVQPGGSLCRKRDAGRGPIEALDEKKLKAELGHAIIFIEHKGPGVTVALDDAPSGLVNAILNADRWPDSLREDFPKLEHALDAPYFTSEGVLIQTDGYNYNTNTYLTLAESLKNMPPVSERPTKKEVYDAGKLLTDDLLGGFTFTSPASRAHAVAALICGFVKPILRGLVPMTVIIAPRVGEGKSLLANTITRVINGRAAYNMSAKLDDTEVEKRITAIFRAALDHILLDNVPDDGRLESTALASVLTSEEWAGRRLGHTDIRTSPNKLTWYATGNKITLARDLERRSMPIIMDSKTERPQDRVFTRNIKTWVVEERGKLVHAVLTIIKYWFCEGQPRFTARQKGSYEEYMAVVGGILDAAGLGEGFGTSLESTDEFSPTSQPNDADANLRRLVIAWETGLGYQTVEVSRLMEYAPKGVLTAAPERQKQQLGRILQANKGRVIAGHRLVAVTGEKDEQSRPITKYRLVNVQREAEGKT